MPVVSSLSHPDVTSVPSAPTEEDLIAETFKPWMTRSGPPTLLSRLGLRLTTKRQAGLDTWADTQSHTDSRRCLDIRKFKRLQHEEAGLRYCQLKFGTQQWL